MAIIALFTPSGLTAEQYDESTRRLEAAGAGAPAGRLHHTCYGEGTALRVAEIWDSPESFRRFGETLMPILQAVGINPGQPEIFPVHHTIKG